MDVILPIDSNIFQDGSNMFKVPTSMGRLGLDVFFLVSERRVIGVAGGAGSSSCPASTIGMAPMNGQQNFYCPMCLGKV